MKPLPLAPFIAILLFTGCVLPIPTSKVVAPSIQGRVVHANTGAPIDLAGVVVEDHKEASVVTARDGSFHTDQITRSQPFWVWWPFGGDSVEVVKLRVARPGFEKHKEKVPWHPKTQSAVYLSQPIALKPKTAGDLIDEARQRVGR